MFAPIPLTSERSPLAHAAELARRRLAETQAIAAGQPRPRKAPPALKVLEKKDVESAVA